MSEWRKIETAPKDGDRILLCHFGQDPLAVNLGYWFKENGDDGWWTDEEWMPPDQFTHWMPLPAPPQDDE